VELHWRDALYNAVSETPGGVAAAAAYLAQRRGKSITRESLRKKLRGIEGESLSMEMAELLTEWMQEQVGGRQQATGWIQSLATQFDMAVDFVPPPPEGGRACELQALQTKMLSITQHAGSVAGATLGALMDGKVCADEANTLALELRALRTMAHRMERNVLRAARFAAATEVFTVQPARKRAKRRG